MKEAPLYQVKRSIRWWGVFFYNTTGSSDVTAAGLAVHPYGLRFMNFLLVSDPQGRF
jgi:hypothetical protein